MLESTVSELRLELTAANNQKAYEVFGNFLVEPAPNYTLRIDPGIGTAGKLLKKQISFF